MESCGDSVHSTRVAESRDREWTAAGLDGAALAALEEGLPASRLWSLLMDVFDTRAARRTPAQLNEQWTRDGFVAPSYIDQRTLTALDGHLLAAADAFESIELSPLAPLGACSAVGLTSQNKIVSALRGTEVVSDPTNVLALECARRLKADAEHIVRVATSHRCVRAQEVPKLPGFAQHFRMFCLATAGRERPDQALVVDAAIEHVMTMLAALDRLEANGYAFPDRRARVLTTPERAQVGDRVAAGVRGVEIIRGVLEHKYYGGLRYQIEASTTQGTALPLIDGGAFDWVGKLMSNHRMVFVATGMGSQLAAYLYRVSTVGSDPNPCK